MKKLEQIYETVASDNIEIAEVPAESYTAYSRENEWAKMIAINPIKLSDNKEKLIALYHEYIHLKYGLMYDENTDKALIDKLEYKANKRMYNDIIPKKDIIELYQKGYDVSEIADELEVPLEQVMVAQFLYENIEGYADE